MTAVSAYIPCFNDEQAVARSIESIQSQTVAVSELFVFDDGSTDNSAAVAERAGVPVIRNPVNEGRGPVRAKAMNHAKNELVLCCDAGKLMAPDFLERALVWLRDEQVAAVRYGRLLRLDSSTVVSRWSARHLYKLDQKLPLEEHSNFATGAALVRKSIVFSVGNYNSCLRYSEDDELGRRLLLAGHKIVRDPDLTITDITKDSLQQVLDRHWRWNSVSGDAKDWYCYLRLVWRSLRYLAKEDIRCGDVLSIPISLLSPHYRFVRSWKEELDGRANTVRSFKQ